MDPEEVAKKAELEQLDNSLPGIALARARLSRRIATEADVATDFLNQIREALEKGNNWSLKEFERIREGA